MRETADIESFLDSLWSEESPPSIQEVMAETTSEDLAEYIAPPARKVGPSQPLTSRNYNAVLTHARGLEQEALKWGIHNVFEDSGYKTLILVAMFDLRVLSGRQGDDAFDPVTNRTFELKTVNVLDSNGDMKRAASLGVSAGSRLGKHTLARYREQTNEWLIGVFHGHTPLEVWQVDSASLEPFYQKWEAKLDKGELNNPKIPMKFIRTVGICHTPGLG